MRRDILELDTSVDRVVSEVRLSLADAEAVRLLLAGGSVVDWTRLAYRTRDEVDRFLLLQRIDPSDPLDSDRLRYVFNEAVSYLEEHLQLRFPESLRSPVDVRDVFIQASTLPPEGGFRRKQILACTILKLMHVIHHMEAADLKLKTSISEMELLQLAEAEIQALSRQMREAQLPMVQFYGNRKTRSSVITKLIAKRENIAATVFDKLRFRVVLERREDLIPTVAWLSTHAFPFNYVIPGQSHNNLVSVADQLRAVDPAERRTLPQDDPSQSQSAKNEFSGQTYRMVNFIVDYPIRLPDAMVPEFSFELGRVVFVMIEFQLVDEETARLNQEGENAHHAYKRRQHEVVARRLLHGGTHKRD